MSQSRQLAAIMFTDMVGYTRLMQKNEKKAISNRDSYRDILKQETKNHAGTILQFYGDGTLCIFDSSIEGVDCAIQIQTQLKAKNIPLRIGIHSGDISHDAEGVYGDGVNVASRIESLAVPGSVLISEKVYDDIKNHDSFQTKSMGGFKLKNVERPIEVFALANEPLAVPELSELKGKGEPVSKSIAVLPLVNMSNDPDQDFFSEGISEEIINTIVQLPDLRVAGRTSSFSFKGQSEDLRVIGKKLGVKNILEGSVRKSANRVRITVQLIEASSGFHLWSRKYDRELDDVFKIQDEIALEVANQLKITFADTQSMPKSRQQTKNVEAYQLYYKGRSLFFQRGMSLFEALKCFKAALKIDPNYALAYSGLADTYVMLSFHGYLSPFECWLEAIPAAQNSLKYGRDLGETHNTIGVIALLHDRNLEIAEKEFEKALKINPSHIQTRAWYGLFCLTFMREAFEEGIEQFRIAIKTDPLSSYAHSNYALILTTCNNFEEAIDSGEYAVKLDAESLMARYNLGYTYLWSGFEDKALKQCQIALKFSKRHAWILHLISLTYLKLDQPEKALKIFEEMEMRYRDQYFPPSNLAIVAAALGKAEYALELAHKAVDIIDPYLPFVMTNLKDSEALRNIPGFDEIRNRLGYSTQIKNANNN
jgi:TolB-like protein